MGQQLRHCSPGSIVDRRRLSPRRLGVQMAGCNGSVQSFNCLGLQDLSAHSLLSYDVSSVPRVTNSEGNADTCFTPKYGAASLSTLGYNSRCLRGSWIFRRHHMLSGSLVSPIPHVLGHHPSSTGQK